jgi:hypothetical protein
MTKFRVFIGAPSRKDLQQDSTRLLDEQAVHILSYSLQQHWKLQADGYLSCTRTLSSMMWAFSNVTVGSDRTDLFVAVEITRA